MFKAEILLYHLYQSWNDVLGSLTFYNYKRCLTFARNYTKHRKDMVRIYNDNEWVFSYRFGKDIWNAF